MKPSPAEKAMAAVEAVLAGTHDPESEPAISARLRDRLGHGWSMTTALQYLTGKRAKDDLRAASARMDPGARAAIESAILMAHDYCANANPSGPLSSGILVRKFKRSSDVTEASLTRGLEAVRAWLRHGTHGESACASN
jgi:hypothetical protein